MSVKVTGMDAGRGGPEEVSPVVVCDEVGLRRLAELLAPYMPAPVVREEEPDRWLCTREAAEYAGTTTSALHRAMAAREVHFEQDVPGGRAWFKRAYIDAWRRGDRRDRRAKRAA